MTSEAWQQIRTAFVDWWRRVRPADADRVNAELDESQRRLDEDRTTEAALVATWQSRLESLLAENRALADQLTHLVDMAEQAKRHSPRMRSETGDRAGTLEQSAEASGQSRVYQAGRDQHIHEP
ncbi:hypothetical protein [Streptomyces sp. NPDC047042]|uniref:hypothetical protein n=1 Tax=Streptomyces sp. NPDC047042 TaxID=3154807 RepID=UPI0033C4FBEC